MLNKIKILLGVADPKKEERILLLIEQAENYFKNICNVEEIEIKHENIIIQMVIEDYRKQGAEGKTSTSAEGVSDNYINGYSTAIMKQINKFKRVKLL